MKIKYWLMGALFGISICLGQESARIDSSSTARVGLRLLVELPFNNISFNMLTDGRSLKESFQHIFRTKGMSGLYSGMPIEAVRSLLWYPRMWALQEGPAFLERKMCFHNKDNHIISHLAAAGISGVEALTMPLYRVRTALMVEEKETVKRQFVQLMRTLYTGTVLRTVPLFFTWDAFLLTKIYAQKKFPDSPGTVFAISTLTQASMGVLMTPIYVVLVNRQKLTNPCTLPFLQSLRHHYTLHGMPIFVRTAGIGFILLGVQAALTAGVMLFLE